MQTIMVAICLYPVKYLCIPIFLQVLMSDRTVTPKAAKFLADTSPRHVAAAHDGWLDRMPTPVTHSI